MNRQWRYDQLVASDRFTLSQAFKRAGWRTVDYVPANDREWPQGSFYGYDKVYDQRNLGYSGRFASPCPTKYVLGFATPRAREARPRSPLRRGRHGVEPCAVDAPRAHRLGRRRQRLGLQQHSGGRGGEGRTLERPGPSARPTGGRSSTP